MSARQRHTRAAMRVRRARLDVADTGRKGVKLTPEELAEHLRMRHHRHADPREAADRHRGTTRRRAIAAALD